MKRGGTEPLEVYGVKSSLPLLESRTQGSLGSAAGGREGCTHTCTRGLRARPGQVGLTDSGRAALQLIATDAGELTGRPIIVTVTGALHVTILRGVEFATASDCRDTRPGGAQCRAPLHRGPAHTSL